MSQFTPEPIHHSLATTGLSPQAAAHFKRGLQHLQRGEGIMPPAMAASETKAAPGADLLLAVLGLAAVATSRALGQTGWINAYREEMRLALSHFDRVKDLAPTFAENHFRRAQVLRHLGESDAAKAAANEAVRLAPEHREWGAYLRAMEGNVVTKAATGTIQAAAQGLTWDDIILPERTKRELRQMQKLIEDPARARTLGIEPPSGLLLYGPPGTGKTTVARVLAAQAKCRFFTTSPAEINNMWMGESEKAVSKLFAQARQSSPSIIFLDEIDALVSSRSGGMNQYADKVVNQFLMEMDGMTPSQHVFVIGATNRPDMLDAALVRGGRLSRHIEIPLPDESARARILGLHTRRAQVDPRVDIARLAQHTEGLSGADLRALVNEAGLQALIRLEDNGGAASLMPDDFEAALENMRRD